MNQLWIASVMVEGLEGHQSGKPDLRMVYAETQQEAVAHITSYDPDMPHVQKKTVIRVVMLDTLDNFKQTKMVATGVPERTVRVRRRRRR